MDAVYAGEGDEPIMSRMVQIPFGRTTITRLAPDAGPEHFKTYTMSSPFASHWRKATCEEYECQDFLCGFVITIDFSNDLGLRQLEYLTKKDRDRKYHMQRTGPYEIKLVYGPGNPCVRRDDHRVPLDRPPFYLVSEGDWRGNPRRVRPRIHQKPEDWVDEFATHQIAISEAMKRG
jgi:hypothetical protein